MPLYSLRLLFSRSVRDDFGLFDNEAKAFAAKLHADATFEKIQKLRRG